MLTPGISGSIQVRFSDTLISCILPFFLTTPIQLAAFQFAGKDAPFRLHAFRCHDPCSGRKVPPNPSITSFSTARSDWDEPHMSKNLHVAVGAPNAVRGSSHENNLRAIDAIQDGVADILCSDYYPPSMSAAVFKLMEDGIELPRAVRMVSLNPAQALGLSQQGSIEIGKQADLVLIELHQGYSFVRKTLLGGKVVYQSEYQQK
ncbi:MAG: hypothetical protein EYX74_06250 [Desulfobulbaceae bacterium]|nr:MAG: hypothetical protein EYX74_06250 [Desulfobulbaceae bacterium]